MKGLRLTLLASAGLGLAACAGPVVLGINIGTATTIGSVASTAATGKGLGEHAVSAVVEKDCRLIESIVRKEREFCEEYGSPAQKEDFTGVASWFEPPEEAPPTMLAEVSPAAGADIAVDRPEAETAAARAVEAVTIEPVPTVAIAPPTTPALPADQAVPARRTSLAAAPPPPKAKPAAEIAATGPFSVQVGSYANPAMAESFARKLRADGYRIQVSRTRGQGRKMWTVVHITGFRDAAAAERAAAAIAREHDAQPRVILTRA